MTPTARAISSRASVGKVAAHQCRHRGAVLGVGHDAQAHRIDAEIADRRAQALFDRPVAVGRRRVEAGELDLLGMLGGELGIGDAAAHGVDRLGQGLGHGWSFSSRRTWRNGRTISACQTSLAFRMARSRSAVRVGRPEAPSQQQNSNMFTSQPRRSCRSRQASATPSPA